MEVIITHIFKNWEQLAIQKEVTLDECWVIIDKNNNWYNKVKYIGNICKIELTENIKARTVNAEEIPNTAFMSHKSKWANAILRNTTWSIIEAIVEPVKK